MPGKKFKLTLSIDEAELFQLVSFTNGFTTFHPEGDNGEDAFINLMHKLHNAAFDIAPPEVYETAKRLSEKMLIAWQEPSVERGSMLGGFEGMLDKSMDKLSDADKKAIKKYAK